MLFLVKSLVQEKQSLEAFESYTTLGMNSLYAEFRNDEQSTGWYYKGVSKYFVDSSDVLVGYRRQ